jgi:hypothetical protein
MKFDEANAEQWLTGIAVALVAALVMLSMQRIREGELATSSAFGASTNSLFNCR